MDGWVWERTAQDARLAAGRFAADGMRLVAVRQGQAVALVWEQAGLLRDADERTWRVLAGILDEAHVPTIAVIDAQDQAGTDEAAPDEPGTVCRSRPGSRAC